MYYFLFSEIIYVRMSVFYVIQTKLWASNTEVANFCGQKIYFFLYKIDRDRAIAIGVF